jgi:hypothetical protein
MSAAAGRRVMSNGIEWAATRQALQTWEDQSFADSPPIRGDDRYMALFRPWYLGFAARSADTRREMVALALVAFGPQGEGDPPDAVWADVYQAVTHYAPSDDRDQWLDLVIAWGAGWRGGRMVPAGGSAWERVWESALVALIGMTEAALRETFAKLGTLLEEAHDQLSNLDQMAQLWPYASLIAMELAAGTCECVQRRRGGQQSDDPQDDAQALENQRCRQEKHRLASWDPEKCRLRAFIAQAVRGSAIAGLQADAFKFSMLYPLLRMETGLLVGTAEFVVCQCNTEALSSVRETGAPLQIKSLVRGSQAGQKTARAQGLHNRATCPDCHRHPVREHCYYIAREKWFLIPYTHGGSYYEIERLKCKQCNNLLVYPDDLRSMIETKRAAERRRSALDPGDQKAIQTLSRHIAQLSRQIDRLRKIIQCPLCHERAKQRPCRVWIYDPQLQPRRLGWEEEL